MRNIKLVFDEKTKEGTAVNRLPQEGEIGIAMPADKCMNFEQEPWKYKLEGEKLVENRDYVEAEAKIQEEAPVITLESLVARIEALEAEVLSRK